MISKDFFEALNLLEEEKNISKDVFIGALENAIACACKKQYGDSMTVEVKLNPEKSTIKFYSVQNVVEEVIDKDKEISLEDAKLIKKTAKVGDVLSTEIAPKEDFGRIAAQTAKQVIMQKLREIERENALQEFQDKENELLTCVVRRIEDGTVYLEMGNGNIDGVMMPQDQVPGEKYEVNDRIKVYVKRIKNTGKAVQIMVTRTSPAFVKRLFENEVPEIKQGVVVVKAISREAGQRTKIAVQSLDPQVDALGSCVGSKGVRVNAIIAELGGEKIDIIPWSENPLEFISRALSPAKVIKVIALEEEKSARVIVPDDKLSLAIGKDGQNVRLAARLTSWKIDVKSESVAKRDNLMGTEENIDDILEELKAEAED